MQMLAHWFTKFAKWAAWATGHPMAFVTAVTVIVVWAVMGPMFGFSDTWQLVINTGTTIVTFLMVFLIQNTQNRDTAAMQIKLDELIRAIEGATTRCWTSRRWKTATWSICGATTKRWREAARKELRRSDDAQRRNRTTERGAWHNLNRTRQFSTGRQSA